MTNQDSKPQKPKKTSDDEINVDGNVSKSVFIAGNGNTVNVRDNDKSKKLHHDKPKKINVPIIVAWIGFAATILAALITVIGNNRNSGDMASGTAGIIIETATLTFTPSPIPTDTVPPGEPTSTPAPPTDTPEPTITPVPPVPIGQDWIKGCISSLWRGYPSTVQTVERGDGCLQEPVHVFSAEFGDLDFLYYRTGRGESETYGLFAPLPESGTVTFTIRIRDLTNVDLLMGIFSQPDANSTGLLMILLNGNPQKTVFIQKDPSNYVTIQGTKALDQGNGYSLSFRFDNLSVISILNPNVFVTNSVSVPSSQKWLFLGYKGLRDAYRIDGTFLSFELKE